jgi:drug/metabolite transporter (DMT)-like permease
VVITWVSIIGLAMLLPLAIIELLHSPIPQVTIEGGLGTLYLGALASALAYVAYSWVLRELDASLVGAYFTLAIVGVATAVVLRRSVTPGTGCGRVNRDHRHMAGSLEPLTASSTASVLTGINRKRRCVA